MLERRHLDLDGLRLSYLEQGAATEGMPSFVLLHGLMGSAETFEPLLAEMPANRHVIALDMPGSGLSERRPDLAATMPATAAFIERFLDALGLEKPCLVGHSHGGAVALRIARTSPSRVRSLIAMVPDDGAAPHGWASELGHPGAPQALPGKSPHPRHDVASSAPSGHLA
jgi:pimeloyl-ACP methyl ester carboxylesterase